MWLSCLTDAVVSPQTHRMQLATGTPSGRCEWNYRCCFALELPTLYDDIKARTNLLCHSSYGWCSVNLSIMGLFVSKSMAQYC